MEDILEKFESPVLFDWICYGLLAYGVSVLIITSTIVRSPYGRYSSASWGPTIPATLGWIAQESPSFMVPVLLTLCCSRVENLQSPVNLALLSMFLLHYFYRSFVYPWSLRGKPTPLITVLFAIFTCILNGYLQGRYFTYFAEPYPVRWFWDVRFLLGVVMWLTGFVVNLHSDSVLRNLRGPDDRGYKIPRRGLFQYVSAANYTGEVLEWTGFAVASWSLPAFCFAAFTFCILAPRARSHHQWYREKFREQYPQNRTAIIPFLL